MTDSNPASTPQNVPPISNDERPHKPADDRHEVYYEGSPLLRGELGLLARWGGAAVVLIAVAVTVFIYGWAPWWVGAALILLGLLLFAGRILYLRTTHYCISNYRIDYETGLLKKRIDTLELWHLDDIQFEQSIVDRLLGVGTIWVFSNDKTTPKLELRSVPRPRELFEQLKQRIIAVKRQRGVIKMDIGQ